MLLVLTGISVERHNHRDALGRCSLECIDHEQLLHDPLVDRLRMALQDEGVTSTNRLLEPHEDLTIRKVVGLGFDQVDPKFLGNMLGQIRM